MNSKLAVFHEGPMMFEDLTKVEGPLERHIEQLWDEVKKLKESISRIEKAQELSEK